MKMVHRKLQLNQSAQLCRLQHREARQNKERMAKELHFLLKIFIRPWLCLCAFLYNKFINILLIFFIENIILLDFEVEMKLLSGETMILFVRNKLFLFNIIYKHLYKNKC